jgi:hypothetical protein
MEHRPLGRTGVSVSKLCLGTMMFGDWGTKNHDESIRIIHRALDAGINFVDTADVYSQGESEVIVGKALKGRRDDIVLATKFFMPFDDNPNHRGGSRRWIMTEVENSLRRLGTDHIDLYQMHRYDPATAAPCRTRSSARSHGSTGRHPRRSCCADTFNGAVRRFPSRPARSGSPRTSTSSTSSSPTSNSLQSTASTPAGAAARSPPTSPWRPSAGRSPRNDTTRPSPACGTASANRCQAAWRPDSVTPRAATLWRKASRSGVTAPVRAPDVMRLRSLAGSSGVSGPVSMACTFGYVLAMALVLIGLPGLVVPATARSSSGFLASCRPPFVRPRLHCRLWQLDQHYHPQDQNRESHRGDSPRQTDKLLCVTPRGRVQLNNRVAESISSVRSRTLHRRYSAPFQHICSVSCPLR